MLHTRRIVFSKSEKSLVLELVKDKIDIIEDKETSKMKNLAKSRAWVDLAAVYNANAFVEKKTPKQLETFYRNWKKRVKNEKKTITDALIGEAFFAFKEPSSFNIINIKQEPHNDYFDSDISLSRSTILDYNTSDLSVEGKEAGDAEVSSASTLSEPRNQEMEFVHESLLTEQQTNKVIPEPQKRSYYPKIAKSKTFPSRRSIVFKNVLNEDWETAQRETEERRKEERHQLLQQQTREAIDQARELHESALQLSRAKIEEVKARTAIHEAQAKYWRERNEDVHL